MTTIQDTAGCSRPGHKLRHVRGSACLRGVGDGHPGAVHAQREQAGWRTVVSRLRSRWPSRVELLAAWHGSACARVAGFFLCPDAGTRHRRLLALALLVPAFAAFGAQPDPSRLDYGLQARALAPGVWVVEGANADFDPANGCNIINTGFIATGAGVLVINTGPSLKYGQQLRALIERTVGEPVRQVLHLNLHPDYFLGNQAFADVPRLATPVTRAGMAREAKAYEDNLYRACGDWMKGTQALLPDTDAVPGTLKMGAREFELREYQGHTDSDLVLVDRSSGVVFAGGLVFVQRIPTTPHARLPQWRQSLAELPHALPPRPTALVPSHGPVRADVSGLSMTRRYLDWLDDTLQHAAAQGLEMTELLRQPLPAEFDAWAARATEFTRNVVHLYPRYEQAALLPACDSKARAACANLGQVADKP